MARNRTWTPDRHRGVAIVGFGIQARGQTSTGPKSTIAQAFNNLAKAPPTRHDGTVDPLKRYWDELGLDVAATGRRRFYKACNDVDATADPDRERRVEFIRMAGAKHQPHPLDSHLAFAKFVGEALAGVPAEELRRRYDHPIELLFGSPQQ